MEKKGWATGQCQGKFPRRDSLDATPTRSLSAGQELSSQQSEQMGCCSSLTPNVSWSQSAVFTLLVTQLNEITSLLWPQTKDDRSTENILKIIEDKRPRISPCSVIQHPEMVYTQLWNCPLTSLLYQDRLLGTDTNPLPFFKTTIKKKEKKRLHFKLGQPLIRAEDKQSPNTPAHTSSSPRPPAPGGL